MVRGAHGLLPGEARDLGASRAQGRMLAFIDADCQPWPIWLEAAATALEQGARLAGGPVGGLLPWHPVTLADILLQFADLPSTRPSGPIHMLPSCNLAIGPEDYAILGGFRHLHAIPASKDVALCTRAEARWPGRIWFAPAWASAIWAIAQAILHLLDDSSLSARLAGEAQRNVGQDHDWSRVAAQVEAVYANLAHWPAMAGSTVCRD